jgi:hypothetical protein
LHHNDLRISLVIRSKVFLPVFFAAAKILGLTPQLRFAFASSPRAAGLADSA